jgi:conjugative relaxase-like TrwC/TraI family protein
MAWVTMMGKGSVRYHEQVVLGRADDFPGQTLAYYGSKGETPMVWGGAGAERLGLTGQVETEDYYAVFGDGGARDPVLGTRLAATKRPGMELVVSAHKSVAVLGVIGRADDMHQILDTETDATMAFLDAWVQRQGGRRGRLQVRTPTSGLTFGRTRHATSRAGDPNPHDHVLVANVVEMLDHAGGWKALDTAGVRDMVHAATAVGRLHAAWRARQLGYGIESDHGPSGKLDHWAIAGVPDEVCELFSKRSEEIDDFVGGEASYRLRSRMARATRADKTDEAPEQLMHRWHGELAAIGHTPASILEQVRRSAPRRPPAERLTDQELRALVDWVLSPDGPLASEKRFGRAEVIRHLAPRLHGRHPDELTRALGAVVAHPEALPLLGQPGARNRFWVLASSLAAEEAIAECAERLAATTIAVSVDAATAELAVREKQWALDARLTPGQRQLVERAATSGRQLELVLGVAGTGKTTALDALRHAFEANGHRVLGTATSGQAARTLGDAAHLDSRTCASLLWRLRHGHETLDDRTVLIVDEAGMLDDHTMLRLLTTAELHRAKVIVVGDHHQLGAVGPGGGLEALLTRNPDAIHTLDENIRQRDLDERAALEQLRSGNPTVAVSWYAHHGRISQHADRWDALLATTAAWETDLDIGHDTIMVAWRRNDVAQLNHFARMRRRAAGALGETSIEAPGGRRYAEGDRVVALAPDPDRRFVTSQRGTVTAIEHHDRSVTVRFDDTTDAVTLAGEQLDADHLDHGYATTVHRAQGATVDRTHLYADGGGRELAYVALSRARDTVTVHCVADDLDQAVEDLGRDWSQDRRQRWTLDTDVPAAAGQRTRPSLLPGTEVGLRLGRLRAERDAILAAMPTDPGAELARLATERNQFEVRLRELRTGTGRHEQTDVGHAARQLADARRNLERVAREARSPQLSRRQRRKVEAVVEPHRAAFDIAAQDWRRCGHEVEQELLSAVDHIDETITSLERHRHQRAFWLLEHPAAARRLEALHRQIQSLEHQAGISAPEPPHRPAPVLGGLSR